MMKKWLCLALALVLMAGLLSCALAEGKTHYELGDKMEDFTATLFDGTQVTLYGLLAEKKAVLINFWATWCGPCRNEFPYMQEAFDEMSDDIAVLAISTEPRDTPEVIANFKKEMGLDTLPLVADNGVAKRFSFSSIPTSVVIDRNGVVCFIESRSITDTSMFKRLFSAFVGDDYNEPLLLTEIPIAMPTQSQPDEALMRAALQITDENIAVAPLTDAVIWPFLPAADGSCAEAGNAMNPDNKGTYARLTLRVEAQAGDVLAFERRTNFIPVISTLNVDVDGVPMASYGGEHDWTMDYVRFDTAGTHMVTFTHKYDIYADDKYGASLRNVRLVKAIDLPQLQAALKKAPGKPLAGKTVEVELAGGKAKRAVIDTMANSLATNFAYIAQEGEDELTLRIRLGQDVNEKLAFIKIIEYDVAREEMNEQFVMLDDLPRDDMGYLLAHRLPDGFSPESTQVIVHVWEESVGNVRTDLYYTVAAIDAATEMFNDYMQESGDPNQFCSWRYADEAAPVAAEKKAKSGEYVVTVTDEAGAPVPGVMIQVCDETMCMVLVTDDAGKVVHTGADYPYEFHVLMVPEGCAPVSEVFTAKAGGDEIAITLNPA